MNPLLYIAIFLVWIIFMDFEEEPWSAKINLSVINASAPLEYFQLLAIASYLGYMYSTIP